jgi:hypothetical protein
MKRELPDSYRWADAKDYATLYWGWSWIASVRPRQVEVRTRTGRRTGRCGSIEQGKRHVERWVIAQMNPQYRSWVERWAPPPPPRPPAEADVALASLLAGMVVPRRAEPVLPPRRVGGVFEDEWETWAWRQDVPLEELARALGGR